MKTIRRQRYGGLQDLGVKQIGAFYELRAKKHGLILDLGRAKVGDFLDLGKAKSGRIHEMGKAVAPEFEGLPSAPDFEGVLRMQLRPYDLLGTFALNDPIDAIPCQGGLISGSFTASGTERPLLVDDGTGRIGARFDGVNDIMRISGLALNLTQGYTVFIVFKTITTAQFAGWIRGDQGSDTASQSWFEWYRNVDYTDGVNPGFVAHNTTFVTRRITGGTGVSQTGTPNLYGAVNAVGCIVKNSDATVAGQYNDDGTKLAGFNRTDLVPHNNITRMQWGVGYELRKQTQIMYDTLIYNRPLTIAQNNQVFAYIQAAFNEGDPF